MLPALDSLFSSSSQGMFNNTYFNVLHEISYIFNVIAGIQNIILGLWLACAFNRNLYPLPLLFSFC
jgi:hypothetical protein